MSEMFSNIDKGERLADQKITVFDHDESKFKEEEVEKIEDCFPFKDEPTVTWINIEGLRPSETLEKVGEHFDLHPLVLEDIQTTGQRPKMEDFEDYIFVLLRMFHTGENSGIRSEQVSLILGSNFVISIQETSEDVFDSVRDRIRSGKGRIRRSGTDYLLYTIIDAIVDNYFKILEDFGEKIEGLEEQLVDDPEQELLQTIHDMKGDLLFLRRTVWPLREVINILSRGESDLITESSEIYFADVYDHTVQIIDTIETHREMLSSMLDIYLSSVSNRMNEVMKVLTIIATIFIPLTFIAGIYGMNFQTMPELTWRWGYPVVLIFMSIISAIMLSFFRNKGWI